MAVERVEVSMTLADGGRRTLVMLLDTGRTTQGHLADALRAGQMYEPATSSVVTQILRKGDGFIDVGAHVGYFTLLAHLVTQGGRGLAFEPHPETYQGLVLNLLANDGHGVQAVNAALGARPETLTLHLNDDNEGESALWDVSADPRWPRTRAARRTASVACMTLDQLDAVQPLDFVKLVKIDAEGWEEKVLQGAAGFFARRRPPFVICEVNRGALAQGGSSELALRRLFASWGYRCSVINLSGAQDLCNGRLVRPLAITERVETPFVFNLLFHLPEVRA